MRIFVSIIATIVILISFTKVFSNPLFETKYLKIQLDEAGNIIRLLDTKNNKEYLYKDQPAPLMTIRVAGELEKPAKLDYEAQNQKITLH